MADRINRVVTKTGDGGVTSMADGQRLAKDHPRVELVGTLDEANSLIGVLASLVGEVHEQRLIEIQSRLFDAGGAVALGARSAMSWEALTHDLEEQIEQLNAQLPPLREFVLPGGSQAIAFAHVVRAVVRRAERQFWSADLTHLQATGLGGYLNRLSDYFFVLARTLAREAGETERLWEPMKP